MAKMHVDTTKTVPMENSNPQLELVHFTTQSKDGDYYDCKKLSKIKAAFATNLTSADKCIQVSWTNRANGQPRITLVPEEASTSGYLTIIGWK